MAENVLADVDGNVDSVIFVELIAQTYAALAGYLGANRGKPVEKGFLVAVRDLEITGRLAVGDRVVVRVKTGTIFGAFAVISGKVFRDQIQLAAANLKLWMPDDPAQP
jgi:predicted hotdog family 3-hydroxylacyl-ACP dehydratase